jgi:hypothetical protein
MAADFNVEDVDEEIRYLAKLPFKNSKGMRVI